MSHLQYQALEGIGDWSFALRSIGTQLRPYENYLKTAKDLAERQKPMLGWSEASEEQRQTFNQRLEEAFNDKEKRTKDAQRRRDRHQPKAIPKGEWVVLKPPASRPEEPEKTFEDFLAQNGKEIFDDRACRNSIKVLAIDKEGRALLLERLPNITAKPESPNPAVLDISEPLIYIQVDTNVIQQQLNALRDLENDPQPRHAPLLRLAVSDRNATWENITPAIIDKWGILTDETRDGTKEQRDFVCRALETPDYAILEGPPGSGKTTCMLELIVQATQRGQRVLLVASTHVAVDNVLERILERLEKPDNTILPVRIGRDELQVSKDVQPFMYQRRLQTWHDDLSDFLEYPKGVNTDNVGSKARKMLLEALRSSNNNAEQSPLARMLLECSNLVCGTTIGILQHPQIKAARNGGAQVLPFDYMILDEASKTTFTEFLVPARHAHRWIISGDTKQLSPYVGDTDFAENVRGLLPEGQARATYAAFMAKEQKPVRSVLPALKHEGQDKDAIWAKLEAEARNVRCVDLDNHIPQNLYGIANCIPELLYADMVIGKPETLERFQHRLPPDAEPVSKLREISDLDLSHWEAACWSAHKKTGTRSKLNGEKPPHPWPDIEPDNPKDWASEITWRLLRTYELRDSKTEKDRYLKEIEALKPKSIDADWLRWRKKNTSDDPKVAFDKELDTIRRVAMPSIMEILQNGAGKLIGQRDSVTLTDGLPKGHLCQRQVSLVFQNRMHPDISAFPREQFYSPEGSTALLQDASTMLKSRAWSYNRYVRRALWVDVNSKNNKGNSNPDEVNKVSEELTAFIEWAKVNPKPDGHPYEVATLTFYRQQEALLRKDLQKKSGQLGNSRNFSFENNTVTVNLCTVDRFQGHEADLVLLSFVKTRSVGFLNSPNRLNVAITRARYQLVLIGNKDFFAECRSPLLKALAASTHYGAIKVKPIKTISWQL